jgi:hypothetical protein
VICVVLGCQIGELLIPEPDRVARPAPADAPHAMARASTSQPPSSAVVPRRRDGRSLPPA